MKTLNLTPEAQIAIERLCEHDHLSSTCSPHDRNKVLGRIITMACDAVLEADEELKRQIFYLLGAARLRAVPVDRKESYIMNEAWRIVNNIQEPNL